MLLLGGWKQNSEKLELVDLKTSGSCGNAGPAQGWGSSAAFVNGQLVICGGYDTNECQIYLPEVRNLYLELMVYSITSILDNDH